MKLTTRGWLPRWSVPRWLGRPAPSASDRLRRRIARPFHFRGLSTLELRAFRLEAHKLCIEAYARPVVSSQGGFRRRSNLATFTEQLFADVETILATIWRAEQDLEEVDLSMWIRHVDGSDTEVALLTTHSTSEVAARVFRSGTGRRSHPVALLRQFSTRVRVEGRDGRHEDRDL